MEEFVNRVANSGLVTFNLEEFIHPGERVVYDIKDNLFHGLMLREKDFREFLKNHIWTSYQDKYVAIVCSTDAIVPTWAYMLLASHMEPYAKKVVLGNLETLETILYQEVLHKIDLEKYKDGRIIIKGCGRLPVPTSAYIELTRILRPVVKSLMFGEACSTVPLYKKSK